MIFSNPRIASGVALVLISGLLSLTSCSKLGMHGSRTITPRVRTADTKTCITNIDTLESFGRFHMYACSESDYVDNTTGTGYTAGLYFSNDVIYDKTRNDWAIETERYWINGVYLTFWSYAPVTASGTRSITEPDAGDTALEFTYTAQADAADHEDLLFAHNSEKRSYDDDGNYKPAECSGTGSNDQMNIEFGHALSCIRFAVSPDDGKYNLDYGIREIRLKGVCASGSCQFSNLSKFTWSSQADPTNFYMNIEPASGIGLKFNAKPGNWTSSTLNGTQHLYTMNDCFFIVPQTFATGSTAVIEILFDDGSADGMAKSVSLAETTWEPEKYYIYKITISGDGYIKLLVDVADFKKGAESSFTFE